MKYLILLALLLTGCSSIKRELDSVISPTGAYYDLPENQPKHYVDTRKPEQIAIDKATARKYVEEDEENK